VKNNDGQALAERVVAGMRDHDGFSAWLNIELLEVAPKLAVVRMVVRGDMLNGFGVCHGGVTFALADSAMAFASNTHGRVTMSIENGMSYTAQVREGDRLTAAAEEVSESGPLAFYSVPVTLDDGRVVALFRGTVYRTRRPHRGVEDMLEELDG
jgi:acyl-CoA thioesterase